MTEANNSKSYKQITLRAPLNSPTGKLLSYIDNSPRDTKTLMIKTLESRFLPFMLDPSDPNYQKIALQSIAECQAYVDAIKDYVALKTREQSNHPEVKGRAAECLTLDDIKRSLDQSDSPSLDDIKRSLDEN